MPFGTKKDLSSQVELNFDAIYEEAIRPAIEGAGLAPIRADEERTGGVIHKPMFERLLLCDFAVADLTMGSANVCYELGIRHAARRATTLTIFAEQHRLPFDLQDVRSLQYRLGDGNRFGPSEAGELREKLTRRLRELREVASSSNAEDSPVFQLLKGTYKGPDFSGIETDLFRQHLDRSVDVKNRLRRARYFGDLDAVSSIEEELSPIDAVEPDLLVDLFYTWRALSRWDKMISLHAKMPASLKRAASIREKLGFALNRAGRRAEALEELESVLQEQGSTSETLGLIGRIRKDQWLDSVRQGQARAALGHLDRAIDAYVRGFEADWRDSYPGINAVTLLDIKGDEESNRRKLELMPLVRFAVKQKLRGSKPIYWDHATTLELSVLENDEREALRALSAALASVREPWEAETTANNLGLIQRARKAREVTQPWLDEIIRELSERVGATATKSR